MVRAQRLLFRSNLIGRCSSYYCTMGSCQSKPLRSERRKREAKKVAELPIDNIETPSTSPSTKINSSVVLKQEKLEGPPPSLLPSIRLKDGGGLCEEALLQRISKEEREAVIKMRDLLSSNSIPIPDAATCLRSVRHTAYSPQKASQLYSAFRSWHVARSASLETRAFTPEKSRILRASYFQYFSGGQSPITLP